MVEIVQSLLICSVIMSILTLGYRFFLKMFGNRYKAVWRYRIWFVIILGFLFFLRPRTALPEISIATGDVIPNGANMWVNYNHITLPGDKSIVIDKEFIMTILCGIWIFIAIGDMIYFIFEYVQFRKTIKRVQKRNIPLQYKRIFGEEKRKNGIEDRNIQLTIVPCIDSPMLVGYLEPAILLPEVEVSEEELHLILRHEIIHYKRRDTWWKFAALLVRCIHWFNPVVYHIADWMDTECESACDDAVLEQEDENARILYGNILLKMIRRRTTWKTRLATSFQDKKSTVQVRFMDIIHKVNRRPFLLGAVIVVGVVVGTGTYTIKARESNDNWYNGTIEATIEIYEEPTTEMVETDIIYIEDDVNFSYAYETELSGADYEEEFIEGTTVVAEEFFELTSYETNEISDESSSTLSWEEWLEKEMNWSVKETTEGEREQEATSIPLEEWETMWGEE